MDRFKKVRELGDGEFSTTYLVERKSDGVKFVIKKFDIGDYDDNEITAARQEADTMQNMDVHTNIVNFEESWQDENCFFILMEFCDNGDLDLCIRDADGCHFSESKIINWLAQICQALKHCHDRNVMHRDIKAANIFMKRDKKYIKLGDFGVSRLMMTDSNGVVVPANTKRIGTITHMAPELFSGEYTQAADIWSLGVVIYHLLNLDLPFDASEENIKIANYPPIKVDGNYSKQLKELVGLCLQVDPAHRPDIDCVIEIVEDLRYANMKTHTTTQRTTGSSSSGYSSSTSFRPNTKFSKQPFRKERNTVIDQDKQKRDQKKKYDSREITGQIVSVRTKRDDKGNRRTQIPLGIEVIKGGVHGCMSILVPEKTLINNGVEKTDIYSTSHDNQTKCMIKIFEGNGNMVSSNSKIGEFELSGFPPKPKGEVKIQVKFKIDKTGELDVEAWDADNEQNRKNKKLDLDNFEFPTIRPS